MTSTPDEVPSKSNIGHSTALQVYNLSAWCQEARKDETYRPEKEWLLSLLFFSF